MSILIKILRFCPLLATINCHNNNLEQKIHQMNELHKKEQERKQKKDEEKRSLLRIEEERRRQQELEEEQAKIRFQEEVALEQQKRRDVLLEKLEICKKKLENDQNALDDDYLIKSKITLIEKTLGKSEPISDSLYETIMNHF